MLGLVLPVRHCLFQPFADPSSGSRNKSLEIAELNPCKPGRENPRKTLTTLHLKIRCEFFPTAHFGHSCLVGSPKFSSGPLEAPEGGSCKLLCRTSKK